MAFPFVRIDPETLPAAGDGRKTIARLFCSGCRDQGNVPNGGIVRAAPHVNARTPIPGLNGPVAVVAFARAPDRVAAGRQTVAAVVDAAARAA